MTDALVEWDPTLQANPNASVEFSQGCPVGYFAEFVAPGTRMAVVVDPANPGGTWVRCRQLAGVTAADVVNDAGGTSPAAILGGAIADTFGLSGRPGAQTVGGTVSSWGDRLRQSLPSLSTTVLVVGLVAVAVIVVKFK